MITSLFTDARQMQAPWRVAGRLLQAIKRDDGDHTILKDNVAHLLGQLEPEYVDELEKLPENKLIEGLNGSYARCYRNFSIPQKISRDVRQKPYTDKEVLDRLDDLDAKFKAEAAKVVQESSPIPCKFFTCGSLEKGHFGARSDVDVLLKASPGWMRENRFKVNHEDISFQMVDMGDPVREEKYIAAFGATREVTAEQIAEPGFLHSIYEQGLEKRGMVLEDGHLRPTREVEYKREFPPESDAVMWNFSSMV